MTCRKCAVQLPENAVFCHLCGTKQQRMERKTSKRANGTGTAVKRPGSKTWTLYVTLGYDPETKRAIRRTKGGFATKTAALEYVPVLKGLPDEKPKTLGHYYTLYKNNRDISKSKETAYNIAWGRLKALQLHAIGSLDISTLQSQVDQEATSHYTAKDMRTVLSHCYRLAVADGQARTNLASYIKVPPLVESEPEAFTEDEILSIWLAYDEGELMCGYMLLMIYTGMMPGELIKLKKSMIDLEHRTISGAGLKTGERKKKPLVLPLAIISVVEDLLTQTPGDKMIPYTRDGFYEQYNLTINQLDGVRPLPPYSCRHTTATALALTENTPPALIQRVMRHTKFSSTEKYIHPDFRSARDAVDAVFR